MTTQNSDAAPGPCPRYPSQWVGVLVDYHGQLTAHHGRFTVRAWRYCFAVPCEESCTGFDYVLEPIAPSDCGLEPGQGLAAHPGSMTPAPPEHHTVTKIGPDGLPRQPPTHRQA